jgi:very-short-patch-repair endonuclease
VGCYVLDFYCAQAKLAVEVDGMSHDHPDRMLHDQRRTDWLAREGIAVLRVGAEAVRINLSEVLERIQRETQARVRG